MKKLLLVGLLLLLTSCIHQKIVPIEERQVQTVHEVNMSKDKIFDKILEWMAVTFTDSKAVIEIKDKENGKIVGKGVGDYIDPNVPWSPRKFGYTIIIDIKDKKYRATYNNFFDVISDYYLLQFEYETNSAKENIVRLDESLKSYLSKSIIDNW